MLVVSLFKSTFLSSHLSSKNEISHDWVTSKWPPEVQIPCILTAIHYMLNKKKKPEVAHLTYFPGIILMNYVNCGWKRNLNGFWKYMCILIFLVHPTSDLAIFYKKVRKTYIVYKYLIVIPSVRFLFFAEYR